MCGDILVAGLEVTGCQIPVANYRIFFFCDNLRYQRDSFFCKIFLSRRFRGIRRLNADFILRDPLYNVLIKDRRRSHFLNPVKQSEYDWRYFENCRIQ